MTLDKIKKIIIPYIPDFILQRYWRQVKLRKNKHQNRHQIFEEIYYGHHWGKHDDPLERYYSGIGSHKEDIVKAYILSVSTFLTTLTRKYHVVDLGCGDFAIGSKLRQYFAKFIACDIVEALIIHNREKYKSLDVEFKKVNLIDDDLPKGEIAMLRQVLQHLCNDDIQKIIPKLYRYSYLILTEHLPLDQNYKPNLDKPTNSGIRLEYKISPSGVVLTKPPFNLKVKNETIIMTIIDDGGIIQTIVYEL